MSASTIVEPIVEGRALRGNPLGDPSARRLPVYLPPGYENGLTRYPVVYLLASFTNRGASYLYSRGWQEGIQTRMDRLIETGQCRPMILAMPDCFTRYGGSQYLNSAATGRYRDYLLEVIEFVDSTYRTLPEPEARAAAGYSSGGYGALMLGMQHADLIGLVADHSGDKYFEWSLKPELPRFLDALPRLGDLMTILQNPASVRPQGNAFHTVMSVCAMAACYSPNPEVELGFDLPVDLKTGELRTPIWEQWLEQDPVMLVDHFADSLRGLRLLYLDCGRMDQFFLHYGCRILSSKLRALNISHVYDEFDDDHFNIQYRLEVSLPLISAEIRHDHAA